MAVLGGIGELYLVATGVGSIYLIFSFVMGHTHGGAAHDAGGHTGGHIGGGHAGGGHVSGGHVGGHAGGSHVGGHIGGHGHAAGSAHSAPGHGAAGHAPAHGAAHGHGGADAGHGGGHGQSSIEQGRGSVPAGSGPDVSQLGHVHADFPTGAQHALGHHSGLDTGPVQALPRFKSKLGRLLLTVLSPMTIASFLAFFGLSGLISLSLLPQLGVITLVPALLMGLLISRLILSAMSWAMVHLYATNVVKMDEIVGLAGKVTLGIPADGFGQISYVAKGMRSLARARSAEPGKTFKTGDRVIIADFSNQVAFVEPWSDDFFPGGHDVIEQREHKIQDGSQE